MQLQVLGALLVAQRARLGGGHPDVAETMYNIFILEGPDSATPERLARVREIHEIRKAHFGERSEEIIPSLMLLALQQRGLN